MKYSKRKAGETAKFFIGHPIHTVINQMNVDVVQYSESSSKIKQTSSVIRQDMYSSLYTVSTIYLWHHSESEDLCKLT